MPGRSQPSVLVAVAAGGALGGPARYAVAQLIHVAPGSFPWATFVTNVTGSFALGFVLGVIIVHFPAAHHVRPFFATGFLGAYTTYSTFAVETHLLVKDGHAGIALAYALVSLVTGVAVAMLGVKLAHTTSRVLPDEETA